MRPSLAAEREREMLAALEACIAESGIAGLTVQKVADRSGYSRGHVRHYLGNKSDQLRALIDVYSDRYAATLEELVGTAPQGTRRHVVLAELFGDPWLDSRPHDDVVLDHLTAYAASHPDSGISLRPMYDRIIASVGLALEEALSVEVARERAKVVVSLAYGASSMIRLGLVVPADVRVEACRLLELEVFEG